MALPPRIAAIALMLAEVAGVSDPLFFNVVTESVCVLDSDLRASPMHHHSSGGRIPILRLGGALGHRQHDGVRVGGPAKAHELREF